MAKILLAEDEKELQKAEVTVLQISGYEVDAVNNGKEAVEAAKTNIYDCIILDIMMPVMDGIEALTAIRASGNVTPVIRIMYVYYRLPTDRRGWVWGLKGRQRDIMRQKPETDNLRSYS